jgi:hypothetical protein
MICLKYILVVTALCYIYVKQGNIDSIPKLINIILLKQSTCLTIFKLYNL